MAAAAHSRTGSNEAPKSWLIAQRLFFGKLAANSLKTNDSRVKNTVKIASERLPNAYRTTPGHRLNEAADHARPRSFLSRAQ